VDFELLSRELLRVVRGQHSQSWLSRQLGYKGKQIHRLESGERAISWEIFASVCEICGKDLKSALKGRVVELFDPKNSASVVKGILGAVRLNILERDTGISRFSLMRWRDGKSSPPLATVLQLIDYCQFNLFEFLKALVDPKSLSSIRDEYCLRQRRKEIYYKYPETAAVIVCLQLDEYRELSRHREGFISEKVGIGLDREIQILIELTEVGRVQLIDEHYVPVKESVDLDGSDKDGIHHFLSFWLRKLLNFYEGPGNWGTSTSRFGMEVFAVNDQLKEMVREEFRSFQKKVRGILHQQSQNGARTDQVIILHTVFYDPLEVSENKDPKTSHLR
jgi:hypothetical protein